MISFIQRSGACRPTPFSLSDRILQEGKLLSEFTTRLGLFVAPCSTHTFFLPLNHMTLKVGGVFLFPATLGRWFPPSLKISVLTNNYLIIPPGDSATPLSFHFGILSPSCFYTTSPLRADNLSFKYDYVLPFFLFLVHFLGQLDRDLSFPLRGYFPPSPSFCEKQQPTFFMEYNGRFDFLGGGQAEQPEAQFWVWGGPRFFLFLFSPSPPPPPTPTPPLPPPPRSFSIFLKAFRGRVLLFSNCDPRFFFAPLLRGPFYSQPHSGRVCPAFVRRCASPHRGKRVQKDLLWCAYDGCSFLS